METAPDSNFPTAPSSPDRRNDTPPPGAAQTDSFVLHVVMGALVLLLITSTMALFHQIRWLAAQANQLFGAAQEMSTVVGDYETNTAPQMAQLYTNLTQYAQAHADYAKVLAKYRVIGDAPKASSPALAPVITPGPGMTSNPAKPKK
jgi:hypothetical protein